MTLNIDKSYKLYKLLNPFIPEVIENEDIVDFSSTIMNNIIQANEHEKFLHVAMLITGKKLEDFIEIDVNNFIVEMLNCFIENDIFSLIQFYRGLNG